MKYPVSSSLRHKGKVIELDDTREMVLLLGANGDVIGSISWDFVIDQILAYHRKVSIQKLARGVVYVDRLSPSINNERFPLMPR